MKPSSLPIHKSGLQLPLLPTSAAGNLPKQTELTELRYRVSKGIQQTAELERKEKLSTELWIRHQERIGLDILVDGEMTRSDMVNYFSKRIGGFQEGGTVRSYGNRYYRKPIIKSKLEWKGSLVADEWKSNQRLTHKPLKAVITGPYTLMSWSFNEAYDSREKLFGDLVAILRKEMEALVDAGARLIQIDEPGISADEKEFAMAEEGIKELTRGLKSYFILRNGLGKVGDLWQHMRKLPVHNFHLEMANSDFTTLPLLKKFPTDKDITVGLVDSHSRIVESARDVMANLKKVLKIIPAKRLWLSSDEGLRTRTIEEAVGKLTVLAQTAQKIRSN